MKMMKIICLIVSVAMLSGCSIKPIASRLEFDRLTHRSGMGHLHYIGSKGETNFFASAYFLERIRYYSYPQEGYVISNRFPYTKEKERWIPFYKNLNDNTGGFDGERTEPLRQWEELWPNK